ncbi:uncharacterized protein [Drosophila kikkawai]|uniref:Uncharacterized protein n=1 Tax=Drosophila kikkawai TaxID=30033 RepID=A0ABM4GNY5_DROKI|nr:uncharacterized protein LOC108083769 [Drosophila kikkawai]
MNFLQLWWILLIFSSSGFAEKGRNQQKSAEDSYDQLMSNSKAVAKPHPKVEEEWPFFEDLDNKQKPEARGPRNNVPPKICQPISKVSKDNKADLEMQKAADAWYRNFVKNRANRKRSVANKGMDRSGTKPKIMGRSYEAASQKPEYFDKLWQPKYEEIQDVDMKLKHLQEILKEKDDVEDKNRAEMTKNIPNKNTGQVDDFNDASMPNGNYDRTLNSLAYNVYQHTQIPQQKELSRSKNGLRLRRRCMNPEEEVKLMTIMRMLDKGYGPVLPSSTLAATRKKIKEMERLESTNSDFSQDSKHKKLNAGEIAELTNSYDKEFSDYDPIYSFYQANKADLLGNERTKHKTNYLDGSRTQLGPKASSNNAQYKSNMEFGKRALKVPETDFGLYSGRSSRLKSAVDGGYQTDTMLLAGPANHGTNPAKKVAEDPTSYLKSYPYAVAKLMADDIHYRNRNKRHDASERRSRRTKRSLAENVDYNGYEELYNYDNATLAHVYDPTKNEVPLINKRPKGVPPILQKQVLPPQQQFQAKVDKKPANFKASFNLSSFIDDINKLQNARKPQPVKQQEPVQEPFQVTVQQAVTPKPIITTLPPVKAFGIRRFFGPFFKKQTTTTTMNPECVAITSSDNSTTATPAPAPDPSPSPSTSPPSSTTITMDNVCDSPDSMKMNVSIKADVCGDPKTKQFHSNGSISLQPPPYNEAIQNEDVPLHSSKGGLDEEEVVEKVTNNSKERATIELKHKTEEEQGPRVKSIERMQDNAKHATSRNVAPKLSPKIARNPARTGSDKYAELISGQLFEDISEVVLKFISKDPDLSTLVPFIKRNNNDSQKQPSSSTNYPIWNDSTKNYQHGQTCIPLPPDLQEFYDQILVTAEEEKKIRKKTLDEAMEKYQPTEFSPRFIKLKQRAEMLKESREHSPMQGSH